MSFLLCFPQKTRRRMLFRYRQLLQIPILHAERSFWEKNIRTNESRTAITFRGFSTPIINPTYSLSLFESPKSRKQPQNVLIAYKILPKTWFYLRFDKYRGHLKLSFFTSITSLLHCIYFIRPPWQRAFSLFAWLQCNTDYLSSLFRLNRFRLLSLISMLLISVLNNNGVRQKNSPDIHVLDFYYSIDIVLSFFGCNSVSFFISLII